MRVVSWLVLAGLCLAAAGARATVEEIATIAALRGFSGTLQNVEVVRDYSTPGDGGGGTFIRVQTTNDCSAFYANGDDGGVVIQVTNSITGKIACYYRQFTGSVHLKWYGIVNGQDVAGSCPGPSNCLQNAFDAAKNFNFASLASNPDYVGTVETDGLRIASSDWILIPNNTRLTCNASFTGLMDIGDDFLNAGGSIFLNHGVSIYLYTNSPSANADHVELDHCIVLTTGISNNVILNPQNQRDIINTYAAMAANGDTAILCDHADQAYIHAVTVVGFDSGIAGFACGRFRLDGANVDANVGLFLGNGGSPGYVANYRNNTMLARLVANRDTSMAIQDIQDNGTSNHLCRVVVSGTTNIPYVGGDTVYALPVGTPHYNQMGVISCHGRFIVANVFSGTPCPSGDTCVDLASSAFNSSSTTSFLTTHGGGSSDSCGSSWARNSHVLNFCVTDPNYALGVRAGETVTVSDNTTFGAGVHVTVLSVSKYLKNGQYRIVVDALTQDAQPVSAGYTLSFYNYGPYDTGAKSSSLYLYPSARVYAGNSIGGAATGGRAACIQGGGPNDGSALGMIVVNSFCFGQLLQYHFDSVDPLNCTACGMDSDPELADDQQLGLYYGHGLARLPMLSGTLDGSDTIKNINLNGTPLNAAYAGWMNTDSISGTGIPSGTTVASTKFDLTLKQWVIVMSCPSGCSGHVGTGSTDITNGAGGSSPPTGKSNFIGAVTGGGNIVVDGGGGPCNGISGSAVVPNMVGRPALELLGGCVNIAGLSSAGTNDVVVGSGLLTGSSLVGSNFNGALYYENPSANALNSAGNTIASGEGNGLRQCNPAYSTGCVQYSLNSSGAWRLLDSASNPVEEFNNGTHLQLANSYQDGIVANVVLSAPSVTARLNVVASCSGGLYQQQGSQAARNRQHPRCFRNAFGLALCDGGSR